MKPNTVKMVTSLMTAGLMVSGMAVVPAAATPQTAVELSKSAGTATTAPRQQHGVRITNHTIEKKIPEASIKVDYPQVSGLKRKSVQKKINTLLKDKAETFAANALKEAKASQPSTPSGNPYEYVGTYKVTYNQDGVLSLYEDMYSYTGGAHGITYREGLTFRLSDGKLLTLDEVLRANPNYRSIVDPEIARKLQQTEGYFGNFQTIGPNPAYYVKDQGVTIFFQLYDYLPYVFGFPEYHFPFAKLLPPGTNPFDFKTH
ncbi:DUF3298 and DUF4163 domain-containing protein [Paenibacillus macerans]|uniref:DUF3298 and DUF4163 domain-containing protein n=1 Tax=Paenibacillus macerans TaxID=44252 RepID=UPI003D3209D8